MKYWKLPLSVACLILGILAAIQFKGQAREGFPFSSYQSLDLVRMVRESQQKTAELESQLSNLRSRLAAYEYRQKGKVSQELLQDLEKAKMEAGMIAVKGPGVQVVLDDSKKTPKPGEDDYFYLVHDVDLIQLVNELWAAGAEAISINGQRLVAGSAIRCVGPTILVNTFRLSPPYVVKAIGDPDTLSTALKMRGGFLDAMAISISHGVSVVITKEKELEIPAFGGAMLFRYSKPDLKP
jgi:uncharacterized protein YlxW (UPF0749 family)